MSLGLEILASISNIALAASELPILVSLELCLNLLFLWFQSSRVSLVCERFLGLASQEQREEGRICELGCDLAICVERKVGDHVATCNYVGVINILEPCTVAFGMCSHNSIRYLGMVELVCQGYTEFAVGIC